MGKSFVLYAFPSDSCNFVELTEDQSRSPEAFNTQWMDRHFTYLGAIAQPGRRVGTGVVRFSRGMLHAIPAFSSVDGVTRGGAVA